jgi:hypothetical protein
MKKEKHTQEAKRGIKDMWTESIIKLVMFTNKMKKEKPVHEAEEGITDIWVDAVVRLMMLTHDDKLHWKRVDIPDLSSSETDAYITEYNGKRLRLAEKELKLPLERSVAPGVDYGYIDSRNRFILEFIDEDGRSLWRFPVTSALRDLMSSVRYQCADVKAFLHDILNDKDGLQ